MRIASARPVEHLDELNCARQNGTPKICCKIRPRAPYQWIKRSIMNQSVEQTKNSPVQSTELLAPHAVEQVVPLSGSETSELNRCEGVLRLGLNTFFEVGNALLTIRDLHLYRQTHSTFESYCQERWAIGRKHAWRLIGAAERLNLLPAAEVLRRPINEFQVRPFLKLKPEAFPMAWEQVIKRAKDGKVTPTLIRTLITEISPQGKDKAQVKNARQAKAPSKSTLGHMLMLLEEAKKRIEKGESELALATLVKIESLLFRP